MFHIITGRDPFTDELIGNISDEQIENQVDSLSRGFEGTNMSFSLLGIARLENQYFHDRLHDRFDQATQFLHVDPLHVMNVYVG